MKVGDTVMVPQRVGSPVFQTVIKEVNNLFVTDCGVRFYKSNFCIVGSYMRVIEVTYEKK